METQELLDRMIKALKKGTQFISEKLQFLDKDSCEIEEQEIADEDIILVDLQLDGNFLILSQQKCSQCHQLKSKIFVCSKCKKEKYCSVQCQQIHWKDHKYICKNRQLEFKQIEQRLTKQANSRNGLVGLQNLGNTCFMNSGLQCLSNTIDLVQYFISNEYEQHVNTSNPLGANGKLAHAFAKLMQRMWYDNQLVQSPWSFKKVLGKFAPQFTGYNQHDSQEFLCYLLDGLHEDCNKVRDKPYLESVESNGRPDLQVAQESWENHLKRNQSHIVDIMHGQYKSTLTCPKCHKVSVTFDPFCVLSLPIPNLQSKKIQVYFISRNFDELPYKSAAIVQGESKILDLKEKLSESLGVAKEKLLIVGIKSQKLKEILTDQKKVSDFEDFYTIFVYELPEDYIEEEYYNLHVQIAQKQENQYFYNRYNELISFTRMFFFKKTTNCQDIHLTIFQYFYKLFSTLDTSERPIPREKLQSDYEKNFDKSKDDKPYRLLIVNSSKKVKGGYPYSSSKAPCDFCDQKECSNCSFPYSDVTLEEMLKKLNNFTKGLQLEVLWNSNINNRVIALQDLNICQEHDSSKMAKPQRSEKQISLFKCFDTHGIEEQLEKDNAWYCSNCKDHVMAFKKLELYRMPKILLIALKRFKTRGFYRDKIGTHVDFPLTGLNLQEFIKGPCQEAIYDCFAVSNHYGGLGGGHYTAYGFNESCNQWVEFDDACVNKVKNHEDIITSAAYVLFYRRRD